MTYKIVRYYMNARIRCRVIRRGLTLDEAREHCMDPQSSSETCTTKTGRARTRQLGQWFDGYASERITVRRRS
jgi:hypothetical protein